jgi:hypothetical protein
MLSQNFTAHSNPARCTYYDMFVRLDHSRLVAARTLQRVGQAQKEDAFWKCRTLHWLVRTSNLRKACFWNHAQSYMERIFFIEILLESGFLRDYKTNAHLHLAAVSHAWQIIMNFRLEC